LQKETERQRYLRQSKQATPINTMVRFFDAKAYFGPQPGWEWHLIKDNLGELSEWVLRDTPKTIEWGSNWREISEWETKNFKYPNTDFKLPDGWNPAMGTPDGWLFPPPIWPHLPPPHLEGQMPEAARGHWLPIQQPLPAHGVYGDIQHGALDPAPTPAAGGQNTEQLKVAILEKLLALLNSV
jgi:hypothetical protein